MATSPVPLHGGRSRLRHIPAIRATLQPSWDSSNAGSNQCVNAYCTAHDAGLLQRVPLCPGRLTPAGRNTNFRMIRGALQLTC